MQKFNLSCTIELYQLTDNFRKFVKIRWVAPSVLRKTCSRAMTYNIFCILTPIWPNTFLDIRFRPHFVKFIQKIKVRPLQIFLSPKPMK
jgi:hypothetical protein